MLVSIALTAARAYSMHGARLHKTSRRDAMARDPRRDLLGRDRDILLRDETETRHQYVSRPRPHLCFAILWPCSKSGHFMCSLHTSCMVPSPEIDAEAVLEDAGQNDVKQ